MGWLYEVSFLWRGGPHPDLRTPSPSPRWAPQPSAHEHSMGLAGIKHLSDALDCIVTDILLMKLRVDRFLLFDEVHLSRLFIL